MNIENEGIGPIRVDNDIDELLRNIASGKHNIQESVEKFLEALPGYNYSLHSQLTLRKYERCLLLDQKYGFTSFLAEKNIIQIHEIEKEDLENYKNWLLNSLDVQTVRSYITPVRQLMEFSRKMGWIQIDFLKDFHLPKIKTKKPIRTVPEEVQKEVLEGEWGNNSFTIARNHLIACLFLIRGLRPLEFPKLCECHIFPYEDLCYLKVFGKKDAEREVMLDQITFQALRFYMIERAHFMINNKIREKHIFLSLVPRNESYVISKAGVQAIIRRIKEELRLSGCIWDLSTLNPQGCRRSAVSNDYARAEDSPVHHPEFTLSGQYGHSLEIAQRHYWKHSLKNAYRMIKGSVNQESEPKPSESNPIPPQNGIKDIFPPGSFFRDLGLGI